MGNNNQRLMAAAQKYLSLIKGATLNSWLEIWAEDAVVEFPYAQDKAIKRLEGKKAIYEYYKNIVPAFELLEERPLVMYPSLDPLVAVFEVSLNFHIKTTGKNYSQDYICVMKLCDDGRITRYREYWDPIRGLEALQQEN